MSKLKTTGDRTFKHRNEKSEAQINKLFYKISSRLMEIYVLFYLCVFPLCMHDKYFDILSFRFELFWKPTLLYGGVFLAVGLLYLMCDALYNEGAIRKRFFFELRENCKKPQKDEKAKVKNNFLCKAKFICERFNIKGTDIVITVLVLLFTISTILAEYPYEAFWGDRGRNQGLFIWLMFYIAYWLVTRFYRFKKWHIWAFVVGASAVCIWGIFNFFLITFGMFKHADDNFKYIFVSSIGNINTYTGFTGIFFGVSVAMLIKCKDTVTKIAALAGVIVASFAQIMGMSDNAILSTGIVLAVAPLALCENYGEVSRYFASASVYLGAMKITSGITKSGIKTINDPDPSTQIKIAGMGFFIYGLLILIALSVIFAALAIKERNGRRNVVSGEYSNGNKEHSAKSQADTKNTKISSKGIGRFKFLWCVIIVIAAGLVATVLFLANEGLHEEIWAPYRNILIFNDSWGTGRGLCWRLGMEFWKNDATLLMKLFGYGPDTFYIITMDRFMNIMQDAGYGLFDSAHNEYFEYFITVGISGLLAYLAMLYSSLKKMFSDRNSYSKIIAMGVLAYAFQAVVNIAIPIVTPVFMILMFAGLAACDEEP